LDLDAKKLSNLELLCLLKKEKRKGKFIYIALIFLVHASRSGMDQHSFTCNYTIACFYLVSVHRMAPPHTEVADM